MFPRRWFYQSKLKFTFNIATPETSKLQAAAIGCVCPQFGLFLALNAGRVWCPGAEICPFTRYIPPTTNDGNEIKIGSLSLSLALLETKRSGEQQDLEN